MLNFRHLAGNRNRSPHSDKTIVELNIRRNFGVSVLGIHRGGKFLTSPGAETMLMAGVVLLVMGKKEAISAVE